MATLYRDTGYALEHLIHEIEHGNIALPDIQRPFVWTPTKTRDLFDSLYRGFPVGTLMFWETGANVTTRPVAGSPNERTPRLLIVDGQQRLTALYAVLTGRPVLSASFAEKQIRIAFRPQDETFEVTDAAINNDPEFIPDITALWSENYRPAVRDFLTRLAESRELALTETETDRIEDRIDRLHDLERFRFQVVEVNAEADQEQVADIFVRINSKGVQLEQADFILTLLSVHWESGRRELEAFCRAAVEDPKTTESSPKNGFIDPKPDQLIRAAVGLAFRRGRLATVYNILRGKDLDTGQVSDDRRSEQFDVLRRAQDNVLDLTNWHEFLKCLTHAGFRSRKMLTSENAVIYTYILWLIGKRDFNIEPKTLRGVIARWFFMAHTTGRYTSSPESRIEADLNRISDIEAGDGSAFCVELDRIVRSNFTGDYWSITLPNRLDTSSARSPVLFAYWAALNLLDAELLFSNMRIRDLLDPGVSAPRSIERHHLWPKAYLAANGINNAKQTNAIANMAFLDWPDNASISRDDPLEYWPAMTASMGPGRLKRQIEWHALPVGWEQLDYDTFLEQRRIKIAQVVHAGFDVLDEDNLPAQPMTAVADLLAAGESETVEYKSTARWNLHTAQADKKLEHVIAKTVCGFLNTEGGVLLIGVDDNANVLGLAQDMATLGAKANPDGYELFLRQMLDNKLSIPTTGVVRVSFDTVDSLSVCIVSVGASSRPVFSAGIDGSASPAEFWVRNGNATKQLHGDDMMQYQNRHWG